MSELQPTTEQKMEGSPVLSKVMPPPWKKPRLRHITHPKRSFHKAYAIVQIKTLKDEVEAHEILPREPIGNSYRLDLLEEFDLRNNGKPIPKEKPPDPLKELEKLSLKSAIQGLPLTEMTHMTDDQNEIEQLMCNLLELVDVKQTTKGNVVALQEESWIRFKRYLNSIICASRESEAELADIDLALKKYNKFEDLELMIGHLDSTRISLVRDLIKQKENIYDSTKIIHSLNAVKEGLVDYDRTSNRIIKYQCHERISERLLGDGLKKGIGRMEPIEGEFGISLSSPSSPRVMDTPNLEGRDLKPRRSMEFKLYDILETQSMAGRLIHKAIQQVGCRWFKISLFKIMLPVCDLQYESRMSQSIQDMSKLKESLPAQNFGEIQFPPLEISYICCMFNIATHTNHILRHTPEKTMSYVEAFILEEEMRQNIRFFKDIILESGFCYPKVKGFTDMKQNLIWFLKGDIKGGGPGLYHIYFFDINESLWIVYAIDIGKDKLYSIVVAKNTIIHKDESRRLEVSRATRAKKGQQSSRLGKKNGMNEVQAQQELETLTALQRLYKSLCFTDGALAVRREKTITSTFGIPMTEIRESTELLTLNNNGNIWPPGFVVNATTKLYDGKESFIRASVSPKNNFIGFIVYEPFSKFIREQVFYFTEVLELYSAFNDSMGDPYFHSKIVRIMLKRQKKIINDEKDEVVDLNDISSFVGESALLESSQVESDTESESDAVLDGPMSPVHYVDPNNPSDARLSIHNTVGRENPFGVTDCSFRKVLCDLLDNVVLGEDNILRLTPVVQSQEEESEEESYCEIIKQIADQPFSFKVEDHDNLTPGFLSVVSAAIEVDDHGKKKKTDHLKRVSATIMKIFTPQGTLKPSSSFFRNSGERSQSYDGEGSSKKFRIGGGRGLMPFREVKEEGGDTPRKGPSANQLSTDYEAPRVKSIFKRNTAEHLA